MKPGTRLGPYEIVVLLGAGGMGEVYRARDARLNRDVAIKILPAAVAADQDRVARFTREAQTLAALNHPHIAHIYGVEEYSSTRAGQGATWALVMELVEGPTLAQRIAQGPIPLDEALPLAGQIAEALECAHDAGIIHRDLKPANIKLRPDGTVKVLDFGLAKALEPTGVNSDSADSPTITTPAMTSAGVILGTAAYMAPEQARGKPVDKRADVWAFGCVLYEMLTGTRAFHGETVTDTLAAIVHEQPDLTALPADTPAHVRRLLRHCFEKVPRRRLRDIGDARFDLDASVGEVGPVGSPRRPRPVALMLTQAISVAALLVTLPIVITHVREAAPEPRRVQFVIGQLPGTMSAPTGRLAVSPDGKKVVLAVRSRSIVRLVVRDVASGALSPVEGSEGITSLPFWAPDSTSVAFFAEGKLKRIDAATGAIRTICDAPALVGSFAGVGASGTWKEDDTILFSVGSSPGGTGHPLYRVSARGGQAVAFTMLDKTRLETEHAFPAFLSDGRRFLYLVRRLGASPLITVGDLEDPGARHVLLDDVLRAIATADHLLFIRGGVLYSQRFDQRALQLLDQPVAITDDVGVAASGRGVFDVSSAGVLAYENRRPLELAQFTWFDRTGKVLGTVGEPSTYPGSFDLSPNGRRLAFIRAGDIWALDIDPMTTVRLTTDPANDGDPVWSPDGNRVLFDSVRRGAPDLFVKTFGAVAPEQLLLGTATQEYAEDWSSDGRHVAIVQGPINQVAVFSLDTGKLTPITDDAFRKDEPHFSPDGRWLAYNSDESSMPEVYVVPFPPAGRKTAISSGGGAQPRWRSDGRELYYLAPDASLMSVLLDPRTATPKAAPTRLFSTGVSSVVESADQYDVAADGRFLVLKPVRPAEPGTITVIVNWLSGRKG